MSPKNTTNDASRPADPTGEGEARKTSGTSGPLALLTTWLEARLGSGPKAWWRETRDRLAVGVGDEEFARTFSLASRHAPRRSMDLSPEELSAAGRALEGWSPQRWSVMESLRVAMILSRKDLELASVETALEECFRYADEGELVALYRSLAFLPAGERFAWRAAEGCRTNIQPVFEAVACDGPYAALHFDEIAWNQMVIKALFIASPVWRIHGLDARLSSELARMALDLAEEKRSAHRSVPPELWLCLGPHGGDRGLASIERELGEGDPRGRCSAAMALARAGEEERLELWLAQEKDPAVLASMRASREGQVSQYDYGSLELE